jgi:hypothetical protein
MVYPRRFLAPHLAIIVPVLLDPLGHHIGKCSVGIEADISLGEIPTAKL